MSRRRFSRFQKDSRQSSADGFSLVCDAMLAETEVVKTSDSQIKPRIFQVASPAFSGPSCVRRAT